MKKATETGSEYIIHIMLHRIFPINILTIFLHIEL